MGILKTVPTPHQPPQNIDELLRIIAARTDIAEATLRGYLAGSHPPHWRGEALVRMWCSTFNADRSGIAMTEVYIAPRVVERKATPEADDSFKELERAWR